VIQVRAIITEEMKRAVMDTLDGDFHPGGAQCRRFEDEFAEYCGAKYAVCVSSGSAALHLATIACGIGPSDEVITASNSMSSSADCILHVGATPIFVEIERETHNMDPGSVERNITRRTRAIIPVHMYGHPADMDAILDIAKRHGLAVIEDACLSAGAKCKGHRLGIFGDATCFSFVSKNMTVAGDGGMVTTNDERVADTVRMLRLHGRDREGKQKILGFNYRMSEISATIGRLQLKKLDEWNEKRRSYARTYSDLLKDACLDLPIEKEWAFHVYLHYMTGCNRRDHLRSLLEKKGIRTRIPYPPIHLLPYVAERFGLKEGMLPITEGHWRRGIALPTYPSLSEAKIHEIAENVRDALK